MAKDKKDMSTEELIKLSNQLFEEEKYDDVIELLDTETLEKHNNAILYFDKGDAQGEKEEYDKAIRYYNRAIELNPKYHTAYNNRGVSWHNKGEYDKSIDDYNKAIELTPQYYRAYNNRGNSWHNKGEYDKAVSDYNKAIELNPQYYRAYYNRGNSWHNKGEYDNAIIDLNKAIELSPKYNAAYNNRGNSWYNKGEYDKAIADYTKAIGLDSNYAFAYNNRGASLEEKGNYAEAIKDYEKAVALNPDFETAKRNKARVLTILGEKADKIVSESYDLFNEAVKNLSQLDKIAILNKCKHIMESCVDKIREHASNNLNKELEYKASNNTTHLVAHYTKLKSADALIRLGNKGLKFRFYNAAYMNDPEEGDVLLNCFDKEIKSAFKIGATQEENNIYLGSFLPAQRHEDELVMWRTYGKDANKNEAAGCSIIIDTDFFDKERSEIRMRKNDDTSPSIDDDKTEESNYQPLYRVIYYDKLDKNFICNNSDTKKINDDVKRLNKELKELLKMRTTKRSSPIYSAINKIVYHIISEVRYFFKSADYAFENEVRVIQFQASESEEVKIDDNGEQWLPRRLYIESKKAIPKYIKKVYLGPKVPNPEQWIYLDAVMKKNGYKDFELLNSTQKYQ